MKEKYVKPAMIIERFTLTSAIARDCADFIQKEYLTHNSMEANCAWDLGGGFTAFVQTIACDYDVDFIPSGTGDIICYHNPGEGAYIFGS